MTAALTEFWRFQRCAIGVLYYDFLGSYPLGRPGPGPYHFGAFSDIVTLQLQPEFEKYMTEAFKPLGVYIKFWGDGEPAKSGRCFTVTPTRMKRMFYANDVLLWPGCGFQSAFHGRLFTQLRWATRPPAPLEVKEMSEIAVRSYPMTDVG